VTGPVTLHAEATAELEAAALWYDDQRDGLGLQFLAAVDRTIQQIAAWPHAGSPVEGLASDLLVRRAPIPRFPYHVAYMATDDGIHVLAVPHDHRRPGYWKNRPLPGSA
jgi:plasmid stabilization system protein ParE